MPKITVLLDWYRIREARFPAGLPRSPTTLPCCIAMKCSIWQHGFKDHCTVTGPWNGVIAFRFWLRGGWMHWLFLQETIGKRTMLRNLTWNFKEATANQLHPCTHSFSTTQQKTKDKEMLQPRENYWNQWMIFLAISKDPKN